MLTQATHWSLPPGDSCKLWAKKEKKGGGGRKWIIFITRVLWSSSSGKLSLHSFPGSSHLGVATAQKQVIIKKLVLRQDKLFLCSVGGLLDKSTIGSCDS